jgi:AcrR family transcriptional regulator
MPTPTRILRTLADGLPNARPILSARELDRQDRILDTACALMARYGRANLTFSALAIAMRLAPATIRRHFPDLDTILFELLLRHLQAICRAIAEIPFTHPNAQAAKRAAYMAYTRTAFSAPTDIHTLLVRERHTLPPDLEAQIEEVRDIIGNLLVNEWPDAALSLLDNPFLQPPQIEATLAAIATPSVPPPKPKPILLPKQNRSFAQKPEKPATPPTPPPPHIHAGLMLPSEPSPHLRL